jgi:hypothetical protein
MAYNLPLAIEYLKTHSLQELEDEHGVKSRPDASNTKFSLNYDQLAIKGGDKLAEQCRGMVVRPVSVATSGVSFDWEKLRSSPVGECVILCRPMDRFYNDGDFYAAKVDYDSAVIYEKLDGTMMAAYWDPLKNAWHTSTRSIPEADLPIRLGDLVLEDTTFRGLFDEALEEMINRECAPYIPNVDSWWSQLDKQHTYVFELTSPLNRVVVQYDDPRITLIATRDNVTGCEIVINEQNYMWYEPRTWKLNDAKAIKALADSFSPAELEGFVVCDARFNRVKIKNASYVLAHHTKDGIISSKRNALVAAFKGTLDDIMPMVDPDTRNAMEEMLLKVGKFIKESEAKYEDWASQCEPGDNKTFASFVNANQPVMPSAYFAVFRGKSKSISDYMTQHVGEGAIADKTLDSILTYLKM